MSSDHEPWKNSCPYSVKEYIQWNICCVKIFKAWLRIYKLLFSGLSLGLFHRSWLISWMSKKCKCISKYSHYAYCLSIAIFLRNLLVILAKGDPFLKVNIKSYSLKMHIGSLITFCVLEVEREQSKADIMRLSKIIILTKYYLK